MVLTHVDSWKKGQAAKALSEVTQEVQPTTEAAGHLLHYKYSLYPGFVHHRVVWLIHKI